MPLQATSGAASYDAFGGGVAAVPNYIEDVFSTQVYTGTGATNNIVNGVDLATYGGLVWTKARTTTSAFTFAHALIDTLRGAGVQICSDRTDANYTQANSLTGFNTNGYTLGSDSGGQGRVNNTSYGTQTYVSCTFREQPKFFDVVTGTQTVAGNVTLNHNLGSVPGCIIVKNTDNGLNQWNVYHRSLGTASYLNLETSGAASSGYAAWGGVAPTSTQFTIGYQYPVGTQFVAYLFAHNAGGFGLTGTDNVISCGSYTAAASAVTVDLGYEPQWVMVKSATNAANWLIIDTMRGAPNTTAGSGWANLYPNSSGAEQNFYSMITPTATGFIVDQNVNQSSLVNGSGTYIYIAIRRGPMKVPTDATKVFAPVAYTGNGSSQSLTAGFPISLGMFKYRNGATNSFEWFDRLRGAGADLRSAYTYAELATTTEVTSFASNTQVTVGSSSDTGGTNVSGQTYVLEAFQRAPSFFDEVCYTGTGTSGQTFSHNLGVVPELMIVKRRSTAGNNWCVYSSFLTATNRVFLNTTAATAAQTSMWNDTEPTSTVFTVGSNDTTNASGSTFVNYLFATCAGVSKVGSYTGNGTTQTIDCGFTGGARFVLIKATSTTGNWMVFDTSRGMTTLTDPFLSLNSTAAETATLGACTTVSTGFAVNESILTGVNTSGVSYIFLSVA
jgi:hypothetical protein